MGAHHVASVLLLHLELRVFVEVCNLTAVLTFRKTALTSQVTI
jgi:hypothetical protein